MAASFLSPQFRPDRLAALRYASLQRSGDGGAHGSRLFGCKTIEIAKSAEGLGGVEEVVAERRPGPGPHQSPLVQIERSRYLDLNSVHALRWATKMLGNETAGKGLVASDSVPCRA